MRKRTRKHRGTAGKMVGGFLAFFCLILLTAGMFWAIQGYVFYQKAVKEKPLAQAVEEARSGAQWASLEQVPDLYKKAVLAVEDHRYYTHHGIDWISMARAVVHDIRVMKPEQGGSTITQQLLKNTVFTQWTSEQSMADKFERKFQEQYLALPLEKVVDKDWILENYLNAINLGQNTLGVGVASERYFGKDVSDLTLSECAVLAAITQSPSYYNPITHPDHNKERRQKVLNNMLDQGYISQSEYDEAVADNVYDRIQVVNVESQDENINSYFVDEMTDQIVQDMIDRLAAAAAEGKEKGVKGLPMQLGIEMAAEMIARIKDEHLCDGVHIMAIGAEKNVPTILEKAGVTI